MVIMTYEDFLLLSTRLQREFTLSTCNHLFTLPAGSEIQIDLFYSVNGNFFVEFFMNKKRKELLFIKSFFDYHPLHKYTQHIDISEIYRELNKNT
jgi:hypothetical protein